MVTAVILLKFIGFTHQCSLRKKYRPPFLNSIRALGLIFYTCCTYIYIILASDLFFYLFRFSIFFSGFLVLLFPLLSYFFCMSQSLVLEGTWNLNHLPSRLVGFCVTNMACRVPIAFGPAPLQKDDVCLGDPDHAMSIEPQTGCFCGQWTA